MDKKSILIGALGASLLFVSIGAGINQNESSEWQIVERIGEIQKFELDNSRLGVPATVFMFEILYAKQGLAGEWIYKREAESILEPR